MSLVLIPSLVAILQICDYEVSSARRARERVASSTSTTIVPQQLSADGQASLRGIIESGNLSDLRWSDFSDYKKHVQKFYVSFGYSLPWIEGMQPTAQAQQLISLLLKAEQKGLSAEDYDGPRWADRLARLKPAAVQPSEADAVRFDAALTICAMRYMSRTFT